MKWTKKVFAFIFISYSLFLLVAHGISDGPIHALAGLPTFIGFSSLFMAFAWATLIDTKKYFREAFIDLVIKFLMWLFGLSIIVAFSNAFINIWLYKELETIIGTSIGILAIVAVIISIRYFGDDTTVPPRAFDPHDEFHAS